MRTLRNTKESQDNVTLWRNQLCETFTKHKNEVDIYTLSQPINTLKTNVTWYHFQVHPVIIKLLCSS